MHKSYVGPIPQYNLKDLPELNPRTGIVQKVFLAPGSV